MDHPRPGLRYVDADDLDGGSFKFAGLNVESNTGEKLGDVDGFILDVASARPRYVVVNAGGWFTSKFFLLPIGHAGLDKAGRKLIADISKAHVRKYPGFDRDEFEKLSTTDLDRLDRQFATASWPDEAGSQPPESADFQRRYDEWKRNQDATWWDSSYYNPTRFDAAARTVTPASTVPPAASRSRDDELITARDRDTTVGDVSPHFAGRAQPGDVLGVETGGERTHVGDTTDDENKRREDATKAAAKDRRD